MAVIQGLDLYFHWKNHFRRLREARSVVIDDFCTPPGGQKYPIGTHLQRQISTHPTATVCTCRYAQNAQQLLGITPQKGRILSTTDNPATTSTTTHNYNGSKSVTTRSVSYLPSSSVVNNNNNTSGPTAVCTRRTRSSPAAASTHARKSVQLPAHLYRASSSTNKRFYHCEDQHCASQRAPHTSVTERSVSAAGITEKKTPSKKLDCCTTNSNTCTASNTQPCLKAQQPIRADEHEYINFLLRIIEDILINNLYTDKELERIFNEHINANKSRLDTTTMLTLVNDIKREIKFPRNNQADKTTNSPQFIHKNTNTSDLASVVAAASSAQQQEDTAKDKHVLTYSAVATSSNDIAQLAGTSAKILSASISTLNDGKARQSIFVAEQLTTDPSSHVTKVCSNLQATSTNTGITSASADDSYHLQQNTLEANEEVESMSAASEAPDMQLSDFASLSQLSNNIDDRCDEGSSMTAMKNFHLHAEQDDSDDNGCVGSNKCDENSVHLKGQASVPSSSSSSSSSSMSRQRRRSRKHSSVAGVTNKNHRYSSSSNKAAISNSSKRSLLESASTRNQALKVQLSNSDRPEDYVVVHGPILLPKYVADNKMYPILIDPSWTRKSLEEQQQAAGDSDISSGALANKDTLASCTNNNNNNVGVSVSRSVKDQKMCDTCIELVPLYSAAGQVPNSVAAQESVEHVFSENKYFPDSGNMVMAPTPVHHSSERTSATNMAVGNLDVVSKSRPVSETRYGPSASQDEDLNPTDEVNLPPHDVDISQWNDERISQSKDVRSTLNTKRASTNATNLNKSDGSSISDDDLQFDTGQYGTNKDLKWEELGNLYFNKDGVIKELKNEQKPGSNTNQSESVLGNGKTPRLSKT